jgi:plasmid stabilization system protein ParE
MKKPIVFRLEAQVEFDEAFDWYSQQLPGLGLDFLECVTDVLDLIGSMPESYQIVFEDVRRAVVRKFPYSVLYRIEADQIVVLAVFHSKRDPKSWQSRS